MEKEIVLSPEQLAYMQSLYDEWELAKQKFLVAFSMAAKQDGYEDASLIRFTNESLIVKVKDGND